MSDHVRSSWPCRRGASRGETPLPEIGLLTFRSALLERDAGDWHRQRMSLRHVERLTACSRLSVARSPRVALLALGLVGCYEGRSRDTDFRAAAHDASPFPPDAGVLAAEHAPDGSTACNGCGPSPVEAASLAIDTIPDAGMATTETQGDAGAGEDTADAAATPSPPSTPPDAAVPASIFLCADIDETKPIGSVLVLPQETRSPGIVRTCSAIAATKRLSFAGW